MRLFYYVHTGHRIGLDRFRRAATIIRMLGDVDITLLTSDFRIASVAREHGVKRSVGVDVVRNIPQIAQHGDKIIFDSAEANPALLEDMTRFFSTMIRIDDAPDVEKAASEVLISPYGNGDNTFAGVVVDPACFEVTEKRIERAFFFGDDDYEEDLLGHLEMFKGLDLELLQGFYWFLGYEDTIAEAFGRQHESESYDEVVRGSRILVTASPQAALENLASGGKPVFIQRPDYSQDFLPLFASLNVPVVEGYDATSLRQILDEIDTIQITPIENNTHKLIEFIKSTLDL